MILQRDKIYCGTLLLVNPQYPLKKDAAEGLIPVGVSFPEILIRSDAANALQLALSGVGAGDAIVPVSGYRSEEEQKIIWRESLRDNGEEFTRKYVALPNHSEHQTGLAIDLGLCKEEIDFICPDFPYEGICQAFRSAVPDYGFIQRYTEDKEEITGISHEPWHFRYVGYPHSKIITENGFSLEEYTEFIKWYRADHRLVYRQEDGAEIEIYFVPADGDTPVVIQEDSIHQISGNNVDGFIVTVWKR